MKNNEVAIGELLHLKDEIAQNKHLIGPELRGQWELLKRKTKALEPQLSGTLLSLVKKSEASNRHHFVGSDSEINQLLNDFKQLRTQIYTNSSA